MKISTKINRTVVAVVGGFAAFTLAACGPAGSPDAGSAATVTPTATARPSTSPAAPTTTPATMAPTPTPTTPPTTTAPPATPTPEKTAAPTKTAAPKRTTARPVVRHTTAAPRKTTAPPKKKTAVCSIRSNAGNCYKAGQFCRKADLGATTTDANGRSITCEMVSGKPHWHY